MNRPQTGGEPRSALDHRDEVRAALLDHYDSHRRDLPWRGETDPYRVLVSEVMLQQTRVETVLKYYEPWLERFPDIEALASADIDDVLKAWEGLGYYRRARSLHSAARVVRDRPAEGFPATYAALRELPGVGEYTAGAVASIAFGEPVPAVDGNVRRVLARLFEEPAPTAPWLRETAAELVDPDRPGDWNQALMELGATICVPGRPRCPDCPIEGWCAARATGTQELNPVTLRRTPPREVTFLLAVLETEGRVMLVQRPNHGLLAGMWAFPEREMNVRENGAAARRDAGVSLWDGGASLRDAACSIAESFGAHVVGEPSELPEVEHRFTHLLAAYRPWVVPVAEAVDGALRAWVRPDEQGRLAIPVAQRRVLDSLMRRAVLETF